MKRFFAFTGFLLFFMVSMLMANSEIPLYQTEPLVITDGVVIDLFTAPGVAATSTAELVAYHDYDLQITNDFDVPVYMAHSRKGLWKNTRPAWPRHTLVDGKAIYNTEYTWSIDDRLANSISTRD